MGTGYSYQFDKESHACARVEGVDVSIRDVSEVCGRIRRKKVSTALDFLEKVSNMDIPVLYKHHNKRLGHRRELGGQKGRYPQKAAKIVLKMLKSAVANGNQKGFDEMEIAHVSATNKLILPRLASKGRMNRQNYKLARLEIVLKKLTDLPKEERKEKPATTQKHEKKADAPQIEKPKEETKAEKKTEVAVVSKANEPKEHKKVEFKPTEAKQVNKEKNEEGLKEKPKIKLKLKKDEKSKKENEVTH